MSIPAIILARGGSKRLPGKNIKPICDRPLIYWALDAVAEFDKIIVGTDSDEIAEVVNKHGADIEIYKRNPVGDDDRMEDDLILMSKEYRFNEFVLLQATSPLITAKDVTGAITLYGAGSYDSVVSGVTQYRRRWYDGQNACNKDKHAFYVINGAIFISSVETINSHGHMAGGRCGFYPMPLETYFDIDTQEEFDLCEKLLLIRSINQDDE